MALYCMRIFIESDPLFNENPHEILTPSIPPCSRSTAMPWAKPWRRAPRRTDAPRCSFGCVGLIARWVRCQSPLPVAVGDLGR